MHRLPVHVNVPADVHELVSVHVYVTDPDSILPTLHVPVHVVP